MQLIFGLYGHRWTGRCDSAFLARKCKVFGGRENRSNFPPKPEAHRWRRSSTHAPSTSSECRHRETRISVRVTRLKWAPICRADLSGLLPFPSLYQPVGYCQRACADRHFLLWLNVKLKRQARERTQGES
ncbi:hypothetical protein PoB_000461400 [Plakobranchus ocellatus]|uniref:Uncharacterized protein n=1 Tax=Plakobranchus ocellatus TaxID=259542 RepID=A0AAV3Y766_9GAST|nr:hypothetical protein PoB_000461400 [Plakobranchus ocellatus]